MPQYNGAVSLLDEIVPICLKIQNTINLSRFVKLAEYVFEADGEFGEGSGGRPYSRSSTSPSGCP